MEGFKPGVRALHCNQIWTAFDGVGHLFTINHTGTLLIYYAMSPLSYH